MNKEKALIVFVTAPGDQAEKLSSAILNERCAACVNILPEVDSRYWWQGRIEHSKEALLIIKTGKKTFPVLEQVIRKNHPYEVPEIIAAGISEASHPYLEWLIRETDDRTV